MDFVSIVVLCAVIFIAVYVLASIYEHRHPPGSCWSENVD